MSKRKMGPLCRSDIGARHLPGASLLSELADLLEKAQQSKANTGDQVEEIGRQNT